MNTSGAGASARARRALATPAARQSLVFAAWLLTSALAVAGALVNGWLGFSLALGGGIVVGALCLRPPAKKPAQSTGLAYPPASSALQAQRPAGTKLSDVTAAVAQRRSFLYGWAMALDRYELLVVAAASPLFIFPQPAIVWVGLLIPALGLNRLYVRGYVSVPSPLNLPLALLLLTLGPSFLIASNHELALPKFMSVVLGAGIYMAILNLRQAEAIALVLPGISILAVGLSLIGYMGTDWPTNGKLTLYTSAYLALPRLLRVGADSYGTGINPNETGGVLAWLVPFLAAAWLGRPPAMRGFRGLIAPVLVIIALVACSILLFLTQSRGAIFAVLASLILLGGVLTRTERRVKALAVALGILGIIALTALKGPAAWFELAGSGGTTVGSNTIELSLSSRAAIWQHTVEFINRFPLLGVGLAMYPIAIRPLLSAAVGPSLPHAHNQFLQAAMDVGLPGLIAYVALLACVFGLLLRVLRSTPRRSLVWTVALALGAGLLGQQLYGLTDAITFAQRPGFLFWIFLGLAASIARRTLAQPVSAE